MSVTHYNAADLESGYIQTHFALRLPLWFLSNPAGKTRQKCSFSSSGSPKSHSRCVREFLVFYSSSDEDMQSVNVAIFSPFPANHLRFAYVIIITRSSSSAYRKYSKQQRSRGGATEALPQWQDMKYSDSTLQHDRGEKTASQSVEYESGQLTIYTRFIHIDRTIEIIQYSY